MSNKRNVITAAIVIVAIILTAWAAINVASDAGATGNKDKHHKCVPSKKVKCPKPPKQTTTIPEETTTTTVPEDVVVTPVEPEIYQTRACDEVSTATFDDSPGIRYLWTGSSGYPDSVAGIDQDVTGTTLYGPAGGLIVAVAEEGYVLSEPFELHLVLINDGNCYLEEDGPEHPPAELIPPATLERTGPPGAELSFTG